MQDHKFQDILAAAVLPKKHPDIGTIFTLSKFILVFYFCSIYGCKDNSLNH